MLRTIWGDPERYKKTYWPDDFKGKLYLAGDGASTDEDGYFRIVGRIDDVLNVSGHRLGTMEIESALVANSKLVAEAAVVGRPDDLTGEAICAFVVLKGRARAARGEEDRQGAARLGRQGDRRDRQAEGHPLRRQPAEDALGQDHAPPAALDRQGRGDHAGRLDAREPGDPRAAEAAHDAGSPRAKGQRLIALFVLGCLLFNYRCCRCSTSPPRRSACRCSTPTSSSPGRCWSG
jgi:hypothetical protein